MNTKDHGWFVINVPKRPLLRRIRDWWDRRLGPYGGCANCGRSARDMGDPGCWHHVPLSPGRGWYVMCEPCWAANDTEGRIGIAWEALAIMWSHGSQMHPQYVSERLEAVRRASE